jgi:uncharacterized protein YjiS (DUF1127 family)
MGLFTPAVAARSSGIALDAPGFHAVAAAALRKGQYGHAFARVVRGRSHPILHCNNEHQSRNDQMTVQTTNLTDPIAPLRRLFVAMRACFRRRRDYRRTLNALDALSDRELADFGVSRQDLRLVAKQAACG